MNSLKEYLKSLLLQRYNYLSNLSVYEYFRLLFLVFLLMSMYLLFTDFEEQINHGHFNIMGEWIELTYMWDWMFYLYLCGGFAFSSRFIEWSEKFKDK